MRNRGVTGLLAVGCIALAAVGYLASQSQDRTAPKITVKKEEISYKAGDDYSGLLKGVSAKDNKDGDLTDQVFVDKVVPTGDGSAIVYYAVTDAANNVGTAKRKVSYTGEDGTGTAGNTEDQTAQDEQKKQEEQQKQDEQKKQEEQAKAEADAKAAEEQAAQDAATQENLTPNGANPAMSLTANAMTIKVGEKFDKLSVVKDAVDDKDDRNTLFQHIHADGNVNTKKAGTYQITYYVNDSNGHTSDPIVFTLTVQ